MLEKYNPALYFYEQGCEDPWLFGEDMWSLGAKKVPGNTALSGNFLRKNCFILCSLILIYD
jgi:hypothetical protein